MKFDMADVKPTLTSFLIVGVMATLFILLEKIVLNKYPIPGITDAVNAL